MERLGYALFVVVALLLMVYMAEWKVKRNRKNFKQYKNGRIE